MDRDEETESGYVTRSLGPGMTQRGPRVLAAQRGPECMGPAARLLPWRPLPARPRAWAPLRPLLGPLAPSY